MDVASLISKYLDHDKQIQLLENLALELNEKEENVQSLSELLHLHQLDDDSTVVTSIKSYIDSHVLDGEYNEKIAELVSSLSTLQIQVLDQAWLILQSFAQKHRSYFHGAFYDLFEIESSPRIIPDVTESKVSSVLDLLELVFTRSGKSIPSHPIDLVLLMLLGVDDVALSDKAGEVLRWRIDKIANKENFNVLWRVIFALENSGNANPRSAHQAYLLWLRWLKVNNDNLSKDLDFQKLIQNDYYWAAILKGLTCDSNEHRKFMLSILTVTVKSINVNFKNSYADWDVTKREKYLDEWARFITLYEVLAVDTSLHQAEAGLNDIVSLISPTSMLAPTWGWGLISTGFKAALDSVRRFTLRLLLSIPSDNLYLIKSALQLLEKEVLPNMMAAPLLSVKTVYGKVECSHVDRLKDFVVCILKNLNDARDCQAVAQSILKVLVTLKDGFAPARILVTQGLLEGLGERKVLQYGVHDVLLLELFDKTSEGEFQELYCQTLNLRLVRNFEPSSAANLLDLLTKFVKYNGYDLVHKNRTLLEVSLSACCATEEKLALAKDLGLDQQVLFAGLTKVPVENSDSVYYVAKMIEAGFEDGPAHLDELVSLSDDIQVLSSLTKANFKSNISISQEVMLKLWSTLKTEMQAEKPSILKDALLKFQLFNKLFAKSSFKFEDPLEVVHFHNLMLSNSETALKTQNDFYKLKESVEGEYYKALSLTYFKQPRFVEFQHILKLINPTSGNVEGKIACVEVLKMYLDQDAELEYVSDIVEYMAELWSDLAMQRLNLMDRKLHLSIIKTFLHEKLLLTQGHEEALKWLCLSVLENSTMRRSLLPALVSQLVNFQIAHRKEFEDLTWLPEVLVKAYMVYQPKNGHFNLTEILTAKYDNEVALNSNSKMKESDIYREIYGAREESARASLMAIFNSISSSSFAQSIYDYIFEHEKDYHLFRPIKRTDSYEEWYRLQLYAILVSLIDKIDIDFDVFLTNVEIDPSPLARMYIEWMLSFKMLQDQSLADDIFKKLELNFNDIKPVIITSYERILFLMIVQLPKEDDKIEQMRRLINIVVAGASSQKRIIRHFSLSMVICIKNEIDKKDIQISPYLKDVVNGLHKSAVTSDSFSNYRSGDDLIWDIVQDLNLTAIAGGNILKLTDRDDMDFITKQQFEHFLSKEQKQLLRHPIGEDVETFSSRNQDTLIKKKDIVSPETVEQVSPLQTKSGAWNTVMSIDESKSGKNLERSDLIVVASLVDKPPNLGGICRLSDVLGAGLLTIHDMEVSSHPQFKTVAVTADRWMPMIEVKPEQVRDYLIEKKRSGYTLIGLEQTDKSVELNKDLVFPKKSLIVLGKEKEGISGDILAELDFCVEIKQVGIIRSMNIQTAAAIIVHAYSSQHC
ncbi:uncharacterized protein LODBEIA_P51760 [Lodderomyces beijingensis]|uniref:tRNA/rRNA methyltransferase SpoU type domain-containing protein n=1 Tax=Lodderomyces beijingensis TaxID=1775926 RepID=A0ABP0ZW12_9ASCO